MSSPITLRGLLRSLGFMIILTMMNSSPNSAGQMEHSSAAFSIYDGTTDKHFMVLQRSHLTNITGYVYPSSSTAAIWVVRGTILTPWRMQLTFTLGGRPTVTRTYNFDADSGQFVDRSATASSKTIFTHFLFLRSEQCLDAISATAHRSTVCPHDTLPSFVGIDLTSQIGVTHDTKLVISNSKLANLQQLVDFSHGTLQITDTLPGRVHAILSIPDVSWDTFNETVESYDLIRTSDCISSHRPAPYVDLTISCFGRSRNATAHIPSVYVVTSHWPGHEGATSNSPPAYSIKTIKGDANLAQDVFFLFSDPVRHDVSIILTSPIVKDVFDSGTFFDGAIATQLSSPSLRAALQTRLHNDISAFAKTLGTVVSVDAGDSAGTSFNITVLGSSDNVNVYTAAYWWQVTFEVVFAVERDFYDTRKIYDVGLIRIQDLQLAKSPKDKPPNSASYRHLSSILEEGGDQDGDPNTLPKLLRTIADRFAASYNGVRLTDIDFLH